VLQLTVVAGESVNFLRERGRQLQRSFLVQAVIELLSPDRAVTRNKLTRQR
jgi:hypothetical protein